MALFDFGPNTPEYDELARRKKTPEELYVEALQSAPEYKPPGKLDRVLNAIQAGAAGFAEGPSVGIKTAQELTMAPYNRQRELWKGKIASLAPVVELERQKRGEKREEQKIGFEGQRVGFEGRRTGVEEKRAETDALRTQIEDNHWKASLAETERYHSDLSKARQDETNRKALEDKANEEHRKRQESIDLKRIENEEKYRQQYLSILSKRESTRAAGSDALKPVQEAQLEQLTAIRTLRTHPEYAPFIRVTDDEKTGQRSYVILNKHEVPQDPKSVALYNQFLTELSQKRSGSKGTLERID